MNLILMRDEEVYTVLHMDMMINCGQYDMPSVNFWGGAKPGRTA